MDASLEIADMFLPQGVMLTTKFSDHSGRPDITDRATSPVAVPADVDIAILINGGTASSSEILTAALSENDRAITVGSTSFGKGISQEVRPFSEGYIQVTTGHFFTPDGNDIHEKGIEPDYIVEEEEYSDEEMEAYLNEMQEFMLNPKEYASTGNREIDGVLNYLLQKADTVLDQVDVQINIPENMCLNNFNICVILGNLVDNGVREASRSEEKRLAIRRRGIHHIWEKQGTCHPAADIHPLLHRRLFHIQERHLVIRCQDGFRTHMAVGRTQRRKYERILHIRRLHFHNVDRTGIYEHRRYVPAVYIEL